MEFSIAARWALRDADAEVAIDPVLFALLKGVREGGHLNYAAKSCRVSYRHAWGLVRDWERRLGESLLNARQGRGAKLTAYGDALLDTFDAVGAELAPALAAASLTASARLTEALEASLKQVTIASSHGDRVLELKAALSDRYHVVLEVAGSETALSRYRRGDADVAGFHLPLGPLGRTVGASLIRLVDADHDLVHLLEHRVIGLVSRPDRPVHTLAELADGTVRFINRQEGSGTRMMFDGLLAEAGIAPAGITGYRDEEYSHNAVAALIASGNADAGFASESAAGRMQLKFEPFVSERFYLVVGRDADARLKRGIGQFCAAQTFPDAAGIVASDRTPDVAALKRIHVG